MSNQEKMFGPYNADDTSINHFSDVSIVVMKCVLPVKKLFYYIGSEEKIKKRKF